MQGNDATADYLADLDLLKEAVGSASEIAMRYYGADPRTWFKDNKSPVSEADLAVDEHLAAILRAARPDYGWLSEETADNSERLSCRRVFIVDPIDGTRAFLAGGDEWTIALSVVENGVPVAGAVYCPVREEMYTAASGRGAHLNGAPMTVSARSDVGGASLTGPHSIVANKDVLAAGFQVSPNLRSLAYRLAQVAAGRIDVAAARKSASDWDLAAADLLVQEAGGNLTDLEGQRICYNKPVTRHPALVAAPAVLSGEVCRIMAEAIG